MADAPPPKIAGIFKGNLSPGMNRPHDVICHQGQYIVTDTYYNRVIAVNPDCSSDVLCEKKQGSLSSNMRPYSIVALSDSKQDFLFTDIMNRCILRYMDNACKVWSEAELPQNGRPTGITVDSAGLVYVADCENHCVRVYDKNGRYCRSFGSNQLQCPWFLKFNSKGHLFVTDSYAGVKIFTKDGQFVKKFMVCADNRSWTCRGIEIDKYDNIFITARTTRSILLFSTEKVVIYDPNCKPIASFGGFMHFNFVRGVFCDYGNDTLVVVDGEWHRLQLYTMYDQPPLMHHTTSAALEAPENEGGEVTRELDDCESGIHEDFEVSSLSLGYDQDDNDHDIDQDCDRQTSVDDYDYDYSDLGRYKEENYNIASPNMHSETGE